MPKILAVTSGAKTPSSRFRIRQHISGLVSAGLYVKESVPPIEKNKSVPFLGRYSPKYYLPIYFIWIMIKTIQRIPCIIKSLKYDYVWLNRELVTGFYTLEYLFGRKIILDVDDAIWKNPPFGHYTAKKIAQKASLIVCGNEYLAEWFQQYNKNIAVIPTAVDTERFKPKSSSYNSDSKIIKLGWIGTHGNLKYLEAISSALLYILNNNSNVELTIVSDQPSLSLRHEKIHFVKWSQDIEVENFQSIDIGLMPLADDEWTKGKCSFKLLQHMSCGSLVVGSYVGMNKKILKKSNGAYPAIEHSDWINTLQFLITNINSLVLEKQKAREYIIENYSLEAIQKKLLKEFSKCSKY